MTDEKRKEIEDNVFKQMSSIIPVVYQPYPKEKFPRHIKFCKNTKYNRSILIEKYGDDSLAFHPDFLKNAYIRIDTKAKKWNIEFDFAWLYRNQPPLLEVSELIKLY